MLRNKVTTTKLIVIITINDNNNTNNNNLSRGSREPVVLKQHKNFVVKINNKI